MGVDTYCGGQGRESVVSGVVGMGEKDGRSKGGRKWGWRTGLYFVFSVQRWDT